MREYDRSCYLVNMPQPRKQRADGERTREAIVREAVSFATFYGLEGLSIGNLAGALDMSKSGVYAHFGSKQELQLATVDEAERIFDAEVIAPALAATPGLAQLSHSATPSSTTSDGGRFQVAASSREPSSRWARAPGPSRNDCRVPRPADCADPSTSSSRHQNKTNSPPTRIADALTFELNGIILAANTSFVLRQEASTLQMARDVVRRRLEQGRTGPPDGRRRELSARARRSSCRARRIDRSVIGLTTRIASCSPPPRTPASPSAMA